MKPDQCWRGGIDDESLRVAVESGRLLQGDADAIAEFRDYLRECARERLEDQS